MPAIGGVLWRPPMFSGRLRVAGACVRRAVTLPGKRAAPSTTTALILFLVAV